MSKIRVMVGCQNMRCAEEVSFHLDMVRMYKGLPICDVCYDEEMFAKDNGNEQAWDNLPKVSLIDLCE